jgi:hypothetical protein
VGSGVDAVIGSLFGHPEDNLWPLKMVFMWAVIAVPAFRGMFVEKYSDKVTATRHCWYVFPSSCHTRPWIRPRDWSGTRRLNIKPVSRLARSAVAAAKQQ